MYFLFKNESYWQRKYCNFENLEMQLQRCLILEKVKSLSGTSKIARRIFLFTIIFYLQNIYIIILLE